MKWIRILLLPVVPFYYVITWFRNYMFDRGWLRSTSYHFPVIAVGNLSAGGTGKTPMVEYLTRLLKDHYSLAILSRGYSRQTKGFVLANATSSYADIGDEPYQYHLKFKSVTVAVDEKRVNGINQLVKQEPAPEVIILDDAFQHRYVKAGLYIMLSSFDEPFYKDMVLPTGNLREPRIGYRRADIIIITKCPPQLDEATKVKMLKRIKATETQKVYFSSIGYQSKVFSVSNSKDLSSLEPFTLITGIAKPQPLVDHLKSKQLDFEHLNFPDHYSFKEKDIALFKSKACIVTTEKDYARLREVKDLDLSRIYYLPITFKIDRSSDFESQIKDAITR